MAPPCPILVGYRLVAPEPCACFPFKFVQESACCSCICRNLETLRLRFLAFHAGFLLVLRFNQKLGFVWWWVLYFFGPPLVFFAACRVWLVILAVMTQSCWAPFGPAILFLFSVAYYRHCFVSFYSWAPMSLCFLLLGIHGPFANSFGLPRPVY